MSVQVNKLEGTAVWLSQSADTSKPALVLFINDSDYPGLYSYDGSKLDIAESGKAINTTYTDSPGRQNPSTLVNIMIYPGAVYIYAADYTEMAGDSPPTTTLPIYSQPGGSQYANLGYVSKAVGLDESDSSL